MLGIYEVRYGIVNLLRVANSFAATARVTGIDPSVAQLAGERALIAFERVNRAMG